MAEIEEIIEGVEEGLDAAEEGIEELPEEVQEEIEAEVAEAREEVSEFSKVAENLKSFLEYITTSIPKVAKFIGKNVAIGAILWGVNAVLNKALPHASSADIQRKRRAIKALTSLIKTESEMGKKTLKWMKEHKDDTIILGGIEVPLESAIATKILPISEAVEKAFNIAKTFQEKIDGKVQFNMPTAGDMEDLLTAADAFLKGYSDLIKFISEHVQKIEQLGSFPIKQADIDSLKIRVDDVKAMPLW